MPRACHGTRSVSVLSHRKRPQERKARAGPYSQPRTTKCPRWFPRKTIGSRPTNTVRQSTFQTPGVPCGRPTTQLTQNNQVQVSDCPSRSTQATTWSGWTFVMNQPSVPCGSEHVTADSLAQLPQEGRLQLPLQRGLLRFGWEKPSYLPAIAGCVPRLLRSWRPRAPGAPLLKPSQPRYWRQRGGCPQGDTRAPASTGPTCTSPLSPSKDSQTSC